MIGPGLRTKSQLASFVVREGLGHGQEDPLARRIGLVGIPGQSLEFGNDRVPSTAVGRVIHIEETVRTVVRMERQTQQALFRAVEVRQALDVEKVSCLQRSILNDADGAALLYDEEAIVARRPLEIQRIAEAAHDGSQRESRRRWRRGWRSGIAAASAGGQEKCQGNEGGERERITAGHWGEISAKGWGETSEEAGTETELLGLMCMEVESR